MTCSTQTSQLSRESSTKQSNQPAKVQCRQAKALSLTRERSRNCDDRLPSRSDLLDFAPDSFDQRSEGCEVGYKTREPQVRSSYRCISTRTSRIASAVFKWPAMSSFHRTVVGQQTMLSQLAEHPQYTSPSNSLRSTAVDHNTSQDSSFTLEFQVFDSSLCVESTLL
jgi:hypothetical protein